MISIKSHSNRIKLTNKFCFSCFKGKSPCEVLLLDHSDVNFRASYLTKFMPATLRNTFMDLKFEVLPMAVMDGHYNRVPYEDRLCICGQSQVEDFTNYLLIYPLYRGPRDWFLKPLLIPGSRFPKAETVQFLLNDASSFVEHKVVLFALAARKIRKRERDNITRS